MRPYRVVLIAVLLASCSSPAGPRASTSSPKDGNFHLTVSNQSFRDPHARIRVLIDERSVVDESFDVGSQHTFKDFPIALTAGRHVLAASMGGLKTRQTFDMPASGKRYGVLMYWNYVEEGPKFTWSYTDSPPAFG